MSSDKLHAAELLGKDHDVEIERVVAGKYKDHKGQEIKKPDVYFRGKPKPLGLNATNAKTIAKLLGSNDVSKWIGKVITIYPTTTEAYGETVECIRVRPKLPANDNQPKAQAANDNGADNGRR